ncbi:amidohydrolase family protein [Kribbella sp. NPDC050124]|uniref:amidohydrolase family protein n=1 Tax=Kribbella sp. NPDC050124 TaxID=3364114 RepID=UPI00378864F9
MVTVIKAGRLIDGTGGPPVDDVAVVVEDSIIREVRTGRADFPAPPGAIEIDYPDGTVLPGLIDAHVHLNLPGDGTPFETSVREDDCVLAVASAHAARTALEAGITTVRDTGSRGTTAFGLRRAVELGAGRSPRLLLSGAPVTITGGHTWPMGGEADGVDGVRRRVRELCKLGADWIKVIGSGGGTLGTILHRPAFTREELAAIIDEAHRLERRVTVHTVCADALEDAIDCGTDQIEHALFLVDSRNQEYSPRVAEKLAVSGIPVTSTMVVGYDVMRRIDAKANPSQAERELRDTWDQMLTDTLSQFRALRGAGVRFVSGTDAGWRFTGFDALPDELWLMTEAGMTPIEAIHAATGAAADVLGIGGITGRIQAGLAADLIVVPGDPTVDVRALRDVAVVVHAGEVCKGGTRS